MSTLIKPSPKTEGDNSENITTRKGGKTSTAKMAGTSPFIYDLGIGIGAHEDSLFVDSILSQTETEEVERMLEM